MGHAITRRAARGAAVTDFSNAAALQAVRTHAVLRAAPGVLPLGGGISDAYVRIDYLSQAGGAALAAVPVTVMPACPQRNRINCLNDPNGASCIRFVRARRWRALRERAVPAHPAVAGRDVSLRSRCRAPAQRRHHGGGRVAGLSGQSRFLSLSATVAAQPTV
jgi:hypothetical protein